MVKRRRASFEQAHKLLEELREFHPAIQGGFRATPRQLRPLWSLQKLLIKEIVRAERKIRRIKSILKALDTTITPEAFADLEERIELYRHISYTWRCFGDAVAFLFMDKFALKQTYFNTHNMNAKLDAGFLSDKTGLAGEWGVMEGLLDMGIPALLTDLTNTVRFGDVCLMIGPDPHLIEVKSGKLDRRGKRQQRSIRQLMEFFGTDEADGLRGLEKIRRVMHKTREVLYVDMMNECIAAAVKKGVAWRSPEDGLYYAAISDDRVQIDDLMAEFELAQPAVFFLNEVKAHRAWSPYSPFTLSIRNRDALFQFIWGDILLFVFYDLEVFRKLAVSQDLEIEFSLQESDYAFELTQPGGAGKIRMGNQMFSRLAFDFTSPAWLFRRTMEAFDRHEATADIPAPADAEPSSQ